MNHYFSAIDQMTPVGEVEIHNAANSNDNLSIDSTIDSILNSPTIVNDNANNSNQLKPTTPLPKINKTSISATVRYECDFTDILESPSPQNGSAKRTSRRLPGLRSRKVGIDPVGSTSQANRKMNSSGNSTTPVMGQNKVAPSDTSKHHTPSIAQNKVAPMVKSDTQSPPAGTFNNKVVPSGGVDVPQVPPENRVVCTVDIHREKSPSLTSSIVSGINSPRD